MSNPHRGVVRVSARNIAWPDVCACCLGPAETYLEAAASRTEGVRVVRTEEKSWEVPYCFRCVEHQEATRDYWAWKRRLGEARSRLWRGLAWAVLLLVLAVPGWFFTWPGLVLLPVQLVQGLALLFRWLQYRDVARELAHADHDVDTFSSKHCACEFEAVEYLGWRGSVHAFRFENDAYRQRFRKSNGDKVL